MLTIQKAEWTSESAQHHVRRREQTELVLPLSMTKDQARVLAQQLEQLVILAEAAEVNKSDEPAEHGPMLRPGNGPYPLAHLAWHEESEQVLLTPPIVMSLSEARRINKQLGEIILEAEKL